MDINPIYNKDNLSVSIDWDFNKESYVVHVAEDDEQHLDLVTIDLNHLDDIIIALVKAKEIIKNEQ